MKAWTFPSSKAVWLDETLSTPAKVIWHLLSCYRNHKTGEAFPSVYKLSIDAQYSKATTRKAITELIKAGAITRRLVERRNGSKGGKVLGKTSIYRVKPLAEHPYKATDRPKTDTSVDRHVGLGTVTITQSQTITQCRTIEREDRGSKPSEEGSGNASGEMSAGLKSSLISLCLGYGMDRVYAGKAVAAYAEFLKTKCSAAIETGSQNVRDPVAYFPRFLDGWIAKHKKVTGLADLAPEPCQFSVIK